MKNYKVIIYIFLIEVIFLTHINASNLNKAELFVQNFANNAIRNAIQFHSRAQTESSRRALIGGVENRVVEFEKLSASFVEVSDKMFDELEKTYDIDSQ